MRFENEIGQNFHFWVTKKHIKIYNHLTFPTVTSGLVVKALDFELADLGSNPDGGGNFSGSTLTQGSSTDSMGRMEPPIQNSSTYGCAFLGGPGVYDPC